MSEIFTPQFWESVIAAGTIVTAIIQTLKESLHLKDLGAVILSVVVGAVVCAVQTVAQGWNTVYYFYFALTTILWSNGVFKFMKEHARRSARL